MGLDTLSHRENPRADFRGQPDQQPHRITPENLLLPIYKLTLPNFIIFQMPSDLDIGDNIEIAVGGLANPCALGWLCIVLLAEEVFSVFHEWREVEGLFGEAADVGVGVEDVAAAEFLVELAAVAAFSLAEVYLSKRGGGYLLFEVRAEYFLEGLWALDTVNTVRISVLENLLQSEFVNNLRFILMVSINLITKLHHFGESFLRI